MRRSVATIVAAAAVLAAGCSVAGRRDANHLGDHVRDMPGVARVDVRYDNSFDGGENFDLTVTLRPDVTEAQVRDVGGYFAERVTAAGLTGHQADLELRLPKTPPPTESTYVHPYHAASFGVGRMSTSTPPTGKDIGDGAAAWLRTARASVVADVLLVAPTWGGGADSRRIAITLGPNSTQSQALALQVGDPALADAEWGISIPTDGVRHPHDYFSTPRPPSDADLQTWREVSAFLGPNLEGWGSTTVPMQQGRRAETTVEVYLPGGLDVTEDSRVAFGVAELLRRFNRPVELDAHSPTHGAKLIIGGCHERDPKYPPEPLQTELSRAFERCE